MLALLDQTEPFVADEAEAVIAGAAASRLSAIAAAGQDVQLVVREEPSIVVPLPARAVQLIVSLLETMADRKPFSVIPHEAELTTQQAADFLNVSRPFLVGLVEKGALPHRKVGRHRRVRFADLRDFEKASATERQKQLAVIIEEARALGLD
ncbi:helix-turn-helix domain-containing protein [Acidisoma cladoniae]|jgi:excisionase family DNA binding protein|uniref:helix-turn-helix domain-containing protein n=1 Tax=Acidisoma cladoniae TaxID=3040935 RepID=UPI00254A4796|nr:helix-turn-helix domain-containing protein [Acidisoma sp. PAMC 29798]